MVEIKSSFENKYVFLLNGSLDHLPAAYRCADWQRKTLLGVREAGNVQDHIARMQRSPRPAAGAPERMLIRRDGRIASGAARDRAAASARSSDGRGRRSARYGGCRSRCVPADARIRRPMEPACERSAAEPPASRPWGCRTNGPMRVAGAMAGWIAAWLRKPAGAMGCQEGGEAGRGNLSAEADRSNPCRDAREAARPFRQTAPRRRWRVGRIRAELGPMSDLPTIWGAGSGHGVGPADRSRAPTLQRGCATKKAQPEGWALRSMMHEGRRRDRIPDAAFAA